MNEAPLLLVVDDDPDVRLLMQRVLQRNGFRVELAEGGERALAMAEQVLPDLVLLDLEMPGMDGFSVCQALRSRRQFLKLPVIMVTAHHDDESVDRSYAAGADEFITKPIHWVALRNRVRYLIDARRNQEELQRTRGYLQNIIDSMPSVLVSVDAEGRVTMWNRAADDATGLSSSEAVGQPLEAIYPLLGAQMEAVEEALRERQPRKNERVESRAGDEVRYNDVMVYPLLANGAVGAVIRLDDVTNRVRIENMMVQTEKMMSVGGLAAGMAHEINNPLGGILQGAQNLVRRLSPDLAKNRQVAEECGIDLEALGRYLDERDIYRFLESIREAGDRAARIVSNMLQFSRPAAGRREPADLAQLLESSVELGASDYDLKKRYDFRHIEIVKHFDAELPMVPCVASEIEQVILNLLKNAAQAMADHPVEGRSPRITLRTRREPQWAVVEVEDNGPGMSDEVRRRVFEPFFTTKGVGVGTGLGMSVSYFIVTNNHGGELEVVSAPGEGSRFVIRLPLAPLEGAGAPS
ncbi:ATP-binding response regulator [Endothiovibrio diazotrophicus]